MANGDDDGYGLLIKQYRETCIDPSRADEAELDLRRALAKDEEERAAEPANARPITTRTFNVEMTHTIQLVYHSDEITRRMIRKAEHNLRIDIELKNNYIVCLEARIKRLEAKLFPAGGQ